MGTRRGPTVVVGLGNTLMGDDGIGLALLQYLRENFDIPGDVLLFDGSAWGASLLPLLADAQRLVFLDAIDVQEVVGTPVVLEGQAVERHFAAKPAAHFADLRDRLAAGAGAELQLPEDRVAIGVQPGPIALGLDLSASARTALEGAAGLVVGRLAEWGHVCHPLAPAHA
jgi:hydrogenase maturation protease